MNSGRRIVLVASGSSPDRAIALEVLLRNQADRTGWSDRLEIRVGGIDGGAGRISDAGLAALEDLDLDASGAVCPDLERRPALFEGVDLILCDRGEAADTLVDWEQAETAQFLCVTDVGAGGPDDEDLDELAIADEIERYLERIDEVLRRIVADPDPD